MRNSRFKFTAALVVGVALAVLTVIPATAQTVANPTSVTLTTPLAASSATNINSVIDCRYQSTVPVQITLQNNATATGAINFLFARSLDGISWDMTRLQTLSIVPATTVTNVWFTNLVTYGAVKMQFLYWTNADASAACTNASFKYVVTKGIGY